MKPLAEVGGALRPRTNVRGRPVLRASIEDRMAELRVPAVSVAVLDGGEVSSHAWDAGSETLFQAASISKPVAAIGAVRLAADGVIDLDRPVNDVLRSWALPDGDGVTIRRILSHSAGLGVHGFPGYERGAELPTLVQILDGSAPANTEAVRRVRPPGEAFQYSGGGYTLMQLLLEDVTGEPFADLMRHVVLEPLGITTSAYTQPLPLQRWSSAASGHQIDGSVVTGDWHVYPEQAAAGLWTTPTDLLSVAAEMIAPARVLDESRRDEMLRPVTDDFFGIGWHLEPPWFQHGGSNAGFQCVLYGSVEHRKACAVMTNSDAGGGLCAEVTGAVADVFDWPEFLREREAVELDPSTLDAMSGDYELAPDAVLSLRREGGVLVSFGPGIPKRETFAASATRLFRTDFEIELEWAEDELTLDAGGTLLKAPRRR